MKQYSVYVHGNLFDTFHSELLANHAAYLYGASENPFHGFGQHCGNVLQHFPDLGSNKKEIKTAVDRFLESFPDKPVRLADLPEAVKEYVKVLRNYE